MKITVETTIPAPIETVWRAWITPQDIIQWNAASDDWHTPSARVDLRVGGDFSWRMEARDGSVGFDFEGVYTTVEPLQLIAYRMADGREVTIEFIQSGNAVQVRETFDAETVHSPEQQREGWQAILNRFARHATGG